MILKSLKKLELANIQLLLSLLVSLLIFFVNFENLYLFLALAMIFQIYIRSLNFSFVVYKALNQAKVAKSLISLKVLLSAIRGIITAFFIFLALKYFGLNYIGLLLAVITLLSSMVFYGILKKQLVLDLFVHGLTSIKLHRHHSH